MILGKRSLGCVCVCVCVCVRERERERERQMIEILSVCGPGHWPLDFLLTLPNFFGGKRS